MAASAACLTKVEGTESTLSTGTGMWLLQLYNKGNEAEGKPAAKLDIDHSKDAALTFTFQVNEEDKNCGTVQSAVLLYSHATVKSSAFRTMKTLQRQHSSISITGPAANSGAFLMKSYSVL